jgi:hypothetical protein
MTLGELITFAVSNGATMNTQILLYPESADINAVVTERSEDDPTLILFVESWELPE